MQALVHPDGRLVLHGLVFRAALGRAGVRRDKQEGDGATPSGVLPLRRVLYRADRVKAPECAVPVEPIVPTDGWCDDVGQADYNRMVRLPHDGHYEELWRQDRYMTLSGCWAGTTRRCGVAGVRRYSCMWRGRTTHRPTGASRSRWVICGGCWARVYPRFWCCRIGRPDPCRAGLPREGRGRHPRRQRAACP